MALPKLKLPLYELTFPSSGKTIKYRPFVVKERSILLLALQEGKMDGVLLALDEIFKACTFNVCNLKDMPIVDSEFLFISLRSKSIGEDLDVIHNCEFCDKANEVKLSLEEITVEGKAGSNDIDLGGGIFIKMKYPSLTSTSVLSSEPTEDDILNVIASSIDCIIEGQSVHNSEDSTKEELKEFVLGLTQAQLNKIEEFFNSIPKIVARKKYNCKNKECGKENDVVIEGLENFFD